ncbi:MAG: hypothetical protein ACYC0H_12355 [Solirubrobacteraceae bacterium]
MKRIALASVAALPLAAALTPGSAAAQIVELGSATSAPLVAPSCPSSSSGSSCNIILERTTAVQTVTNGTINPTKVKKAGWIVAFTVGLSNLSTDPKTELGYLKGLDRTYGGTPQLMLTVLKPGKHNSYSVAAQSGIYHLIPFLGTVLQQPLSLPDTFTTFTALPVQPGDVIGVTVPTWAPILTYNLTTTQYAYRQSRSSSCASATKVQTAQTTIGATATYGCDYTGTRVEYTATEVVNQPYPATYVGGPSKKKPTKKKGVRHARFHRAERHHVERRRVERPAARGLGGGAGGAPLAG